MSSLTFRSLIDLDADARCELPSNECKEDTIPGNSIIPYDRGPLARASDARHQRAFTRELTEVKRPARLAQARISSAAQVTAAALQATAALSSLEAQLATDEIVARRLGVIMNTATAVIAAEVAGLAFQE